MFSDFTFNGKGNDEFGIMCVSMYDSGKTQYSGQTTKLITEIAGKGLEFQIVDQKYEKPMQFYFQVVNKDLSDITPEQERNLNKWLCRRGMFSWMFIHEPRYVDIYFRANISNPHIIVVSDVIGLEYTVTTSAATCFSDLHEYTVYLTHSDNAFDLFMFNDDECAIQPYLEIEFHEAGNFRLYNEAEENEERAFILNNVSVDEKITIVHDPFPDFLSSLKSHEIWEDCNLFWPQLYDGENRITANLDCTICLKYRETRRLILY